MATKKVTQINFSSEELNDILTNCHATTERIEKLEVVAAQLEELKELSSKLEDFDELNSKLEALNDVHTRLNNMDTSISNVNSQITTINSKLITVDSKILALENLHNGEPEDPEQPEVGTLTLNKTSITFTSENETVKLSAYYNGTKIADTSVVWSSNNDTIAYVDTLGNVMALANGSTTISAAYLGQIANCIVTVNIEEVIEPDPEPEQPVEGAATSSDNYTLVDKNGVVLLTADNVEIPDDEEGGGMVVIDPEKNSVMYYGAKGDGVTDDTNAIVQCFDYCTTNKQAMYFPNGKYILNQQLKKAAAITESNADIPIFIEGESAHGVIINTTNDTKPLIDVSRSKKVYMKNLASENSWFHCVQYGDDFEGFSKVRDVQLYNVVSLCRDHSYPSWNIMINAPAPTNYSKEETDSLYNRYPLEIVSNSGYNSIMINNLANKGTDGTESYPSDNSSIGIIDTVQNASGAILVDCKTRSSFQVQNTDASTKSAVRNGVVYEIDKSGHVSVGCSTQNSDSAAPGVGTMKLRDKGPSIYLYDANNSNRKAVFREDNNIVKIGGYSTDGTFYGLEINTDTGAITVKGNIN